MNLLMTMPVEDPRWTAVTTRDPRADGSFFYSVRTTGVYCRPSCPARRPRRENVAFYPTTAAAEEAGFRPCLRCRPTQPLEEQLCAKITQACRILENSESSPSLPELALQVGLSASHLHRSFKRITGLTPRAYRAAQRESRLREGLQQGRNVTDAIYEAGYGSTSRVYERTGEILGMSPGAFKKGGVDSRIRFAIGECKLGSILVAQSQRGLCAIDLGEDGEHLARDLQARFPHAEFAGDDPHFCSLVAQVVAFVEAPQTGLRLPMDIQGTAFQKRVWEALRTIPPGQNMSYSDLARAIGQPKAVRAVASACAANVLAVAIPCHRVVRIDGSLSGYRWGVERKRSLLQDEAAGARDQVKGFQSSADGPSPG